MANALYDYGREGFLAGDISWSTDDIKAALIDTGTYTVDLSTHQHHDDLSGIVATSGNLSSKTVSNGIADGADITYSSLTGSTVEAIVLYQDTGVSSTSRLIAYIDTVVNFPIVPNGTDVTITWSDTTNKIFKL